MKKIIIAAAVFLCANVIVFSAPIVEARQKSDQSPGGNEGSDVSVDAAALEHFNKGMDFYNANKFDLAITEFNNALGISPEFTNAYVGRGNCYDNKDDAAKALENYLLAGKYDKNYLLFAYGYECASDDLLQNYEEAITVLSECISLNINTFIAYCMRGNSYISLGNYDKAAHDYGEAIRLNPNIFQPYFSRGTLHIAQGKNDRAIEDLEKSAELCPDFYIAYYYLSLLYAREGNLGKATEMMLIYQSASSKTDV